MKNIFLIKVFILVFLNSVILNAQSFKVRNDAAIQIGYETYKYLSFGIQNSSTNNGQWAIEHWEGGLNFWKPWPSGNSGNYKLFLKDNGNVGIGRNPSYKLDVQGDIATYGTLRISSDKRFKTEIRPIYSSMNKLSQLNGVSYKKELPEKYQNENQTQSVEDIVKQQTILADTILSRVNTELKSNFGFIAQELQKIFPELVSEDDNGYLSIDYISLIPVLVEAMKELESEINMLKEKISQNEYLKSSSILTNTDYLVTDTHSSAKLYQNSPNPFNADTEIKYYLPENVKVAFIGIYNLNGNQIKLIKVKNRGYNSELINRAELSAGIYIYTLIVDGQKIDSKQMILID